MAKAGSVLNSLHDIDLACNLIQGTTCIRDMIEFKINRGFKIKDGKPVLSVTWYQQFMKQHAHTLKQGQCIPKVQKNTFRGCTIMCMKQCMKQVLLSFLMNQSCTIKKEQSQPM
jgi:hypothetical protein